MAINQDDIVLRMTVSEDGETQFSDSTESKIFTNLGAPFSATMGRWLEAQMDLFSIGSNSKSYVVVDYFRVTAD